MLGTREGTNLAGHDFNHKIRIEKVKKTFARMETGKVTKPDGILIEA